jgi:peptidoglycan/LPS O-acetylase OafA/YrhL
MSSAIPPQGVPFAKGQSGGGRIRELDGLRGVAVGLVLLQHFWPNAGTAGGQASFSEIGWIGVDIFFGLSGFLITGILLDSVEEGDYYRRFYIRRAFRIFPLYYAFLILTFGFLWFWQGGVALRQMEKEWGSPAWFFVYLANFICSARGSFPPFAPLGPPWSLQIEEQFYVVFPFLVRRLRLRLWMFLSGVIATALLYRIAMFALFPNDAAIQYFGTVARMDGLAFGGLAAFAVRYAPRAAAGRWIGFAPAGLIPLALLYGVTGPSASGVLVRTVGYTLNGACFAALLLWTVAHQGQGRTGLLRLAPLRFLGRISYGAYLMQLPVQSALKLLTHTPTGSMVRTPGQSVLWTSATLAVAWISWEVFEKPLLAWGHSLAARARARSVTVAMR